MPEFVHAPPGGLAGKSVLTVSIGPVQPFIAAARTVRDLWSGSMILTHLAYCGVKRAGDFGEVVFPRWVADAPPSEPCLPNRIVALVDTSKAGEAADECVKAIRDGWHQLADAVRGDLARRWGADFPGWDARWNDQIGGYFDVRATAVPAGDRSYAEAIAQAERVAGAGKHVRHFPRDSVADPDGHTPEKCSLLGTFEQMGPGHRAKSREFWEKARQVSDLKERDALCAVSLTKRLSGPFYFARVQGKPRSEFHFPDTHKIAATGWMNKAKIDPDEIKNGLWLHAQRPDATDDMPECRPPKLFGRIQATRIEYGPPPSYLAVLMMDGDNMGERLKKLDNRDGHADFSDTLNRFATGPVPRLVESHRGTLIYAGGDDVFALLPTDAALACADELRKAFAETLKDATMSAGVAVVHAKEDLRFALQAARDAEKRAKTGGKNAAELVVCRRSGEHGSVRLPWKIIDRFQRLVAEFAAGKSDRWAYHLRAGQGTLGGLPGVAVEAEIVRQADRSESPPMSADELRDFYQCYRAAIKKLDADAFPAFLTLVLSASFLSRGRDE